LLGRGRPHRALRCDNRPIPKDIANGMCGASRAVRAAQAEGPLWVDSGRYLPDDEMAPVAHSSHCQTRREVLYQINPRHSARVTGSPYFTRTHNRLFLKAGDAIGADRDPSKLSSYALISIA
jgi:hypothetical protein